MLPPLGRVLQWMLLSFLRRVLMSACVFSFSMGLLLSVWYQYDAKTVWKRKLFGLNQLRCRDNSEKRVADASGTKKNSTGIKTMTVLIMDTTWKCFLLSDWAFAFSTTKPALLKNYRCEDRIWSSSSSSLTPLMAIIAQISTALCHLNWDFPLLEWRNPNFPLHSYGLDNVMTDRKAKMFCRETNWGIQ